MYKNALKYRCTQLAATLAITSIITIGSIHVTNGEIYGTGNVDVQLASNNFEIHYSEYAPIDKQLDGLYNLIAHKVGIDEKYVYMLHQIAKKELVYVNDYADIFSDETSDLFRPPMSIQGASTNYIEADFVLNNTIDRPSEYFLPDALYSVASDVSRIMHIRHRINSRSTKNKYYALTESVQNDIDFYEAVMLYVGDNRESAKNFYTAYESILQEKDIGENICEYNKNGDIVIKLRFREILRENNITNYNSLMALSTLFSYDENIVMNNTIEKLEEIYTIPYVIGETSRENMMLAAMSLVGKVRYIWGGGHNGASYVKGINPVWKQFNRLYPSEQTSTLSDDTIVKNDGFGTCIKPSGSWCPVHGYQSSSFHGQSMHSLDEYIDIRKDLFDSIDLTDTKYRDMLSTVNYDNGVNEHIIDGLDCSGFTSWMFNQITDEYKFNTAAKYFTGQNGLSKISMNEVLLPGDIFAWDTHIVTIVGRVSDSYSTYVTVEETPNVLRYGVGYYSFATNDEIEKAKEIAAQANELIGGLNRGYEPPHVYCINYIGNIAVQPVVTVSDNEIEQETSEETQVTSEENVQQQHVENNNEQLVNNQEQLATSEDTQVTSEENTENEVLIDNTKDATSEENIETSEVEEVQLPWWYYYPLFESEGIIYADTMSIARFNGTFIDDDKIIEKYNKTFKDMTAQEILQYTIEKLPISYVTGYEKYDGDIFDKTKIATNLVKQGEN